MTLPFVKDGDRIVIAANGRYQDFEAVCFALIMGPKGKVIVGDSGLNNIKNGHQNLLDEGRLQLVITSGDSNRLVNSEYDMVIVDSEYSWRQIRDGIKLKKGRQYFIADKWP